MNILTKISVVVLVLLILVFCVVVIQVATLTPNYKYLYAGEQQKNAELSQENRIGALAAMRAQAELALDKASSNAKMEGVSSQLASTNKDLAEEKARFADLQNKYATMDATIKKVETDLVAKEDRNKKLSDDLAAAQGEIAKMTTDKLKIGEELNRQTLNAERFQRESEFLRQQLAQAEEKIGELERKIAEGPRVAPGKTEPGAAAPRPDVNIIGKLTAVKAGIASINIGSAKGVKSGMVATISRGPNYVAQIELRDVDVNQAAGVIIKPKMEPQAGDEIVIPSER